MSVTLLSGEGPSAPSAPPRRRGVDGHLTTWQRLQKRRFVEEHPLFGGSDLRCREELGRFQTVSDASRVLSKKPFGIAYLIMGEASILAKEAAMWTNSSDFYQLTYQTQKRDAIFCPDLLLREDDQRAYSQGRNLLLLAAHLEELRRGFSYQYYIFSDADTRVAGKWHSALAGFIAFLHKWEPAVGVPLWLNSGYQPMLYTHMFNIEATVDPGTPRTVYHYDALFIAVHNEAAAVLLPLDADLDFDNPTIATWRFLVLASLLFRGHVLLHPGMEVHQYVHGRPKHGRLAEDQCEQVSRAIRGEVPGSLRQCVLDVWTDFAMACSPMGFTARRLLPMVSPNLTLRLPGRQAALRNGESGRVFLHSYFPWGRARRKDRRDYATASVASVDPCDDDPPVWRQLWRRSCPILGRRPLSECTTCSLHFAFDRPLSES